MAFNQMRGEGYVLNFFNITHLWDYIMFLFVKTQAHVAKRLLQSGNKCPLRTKH